MVSFLVNLDKVVQIILMVACWCLWRWRNKYIFDEDLQHLNDHI